MTLPWLWGDLTASCAWFQSIFRLPEGLFCWNLLLLIMLFLKNITCSHLFRCCFKVTIHKLKITEWVGYSLVELENCSTSQKFTHSVRPHIIIAWLKIHWNPVFIETTRAWLILSGRFILYSVAYQKADQDIMKSGPHSLKGGPHSFKKSLFKLVGPPYNI